MNSAAQILAGTVGQISLVYNTRLSSIKSLFLLATNSTADSCGKFDAVDITKSNGTVQFQVAGVSYPQTPYSTSQNKAGMLMSLRQAVGSIFDRTNSLSINAVEFNRIDGDATTLIAPGKHIPAVDTEIVDSSYILSGISSANSAITVQVQCGTALTDPHSCNLVIAYDAILEVDFVQGQVSVKM